MPKIKDIPPKQTLEVTYSDGRIENCTAPYYEITSRFKKLVEYLLSCYDGSIKRVLSALKSMRVYVKYDLIGNETTKY